MKCRCCGQDLPAKALLEYRNMPKSAQFFPDAEAASTECGVELRLHQCRFCGVLQLAGEPVPYYREVIRATRVSPEMREFRIGQFSRWIEKYHLQGKRIVEIGCGAGEFMEMMDAAGTKPCGIEYSKTLAERAIADGYQVWPVFIESEKTRIPEGPYDAFYILSFLEHNPSPSANLRGIANNLKEGAVGLVEVPDVDMILREHLYSEFIQDHLLYFTEDTLRRLLEWNGFEVLSCDSIWHGYVISAEVRKRRQIDVSAFLHKQEAVKHDVDAFLSNMEGRQLITAVWGAGHQALADLSLLDMAARIRCVLDSADFKQGKMTPATHIPIVSPGVLDNGEIGAVLVIAGSYSDEILRILREKYPKVLRAVLKNDGVEIDS